MVTRKCTGCGKPLNVGKGSKKRFHSIACMAKSKKKYPDTTEHKERRSEVSRSVGRCK